MKKIFNHTMSVCQKCQRKINARIVEKNQQIFMEKFCSEHGFSDTLISSDPQWYYESQFYIKPRQIPLNIKNNFFKGCPESCGNCTEHQQHTCLPVIEITDRCDLSCPVCLKNFTNLSELTIAQFNDIIDSLIRYEGTLPIINLSGGEPTLHPEFEKLINIAVQKDVSAITVSTNGLTLLKDDSLRKIFKKNNLIAALQFDGLNPEVYQQLRGKDLLPQKLDLIQILEKEEIKYSLIATIANQINQDEIPEITNFFFNSKALSLMFQPVTFTGSAKNFDISVHRITIPDIIHAAEKSPFVNTGDFSPLPCSHYSCFALSYYLHIEDNKYLGLKDFLGKDKFIDIIANKSLPGLDQSGYAIMKEKIYELWSAADSSDLNEKILNRIKKIIQEMSSPDFSQKKALNLGYGSMKAVFIHHFMDADNFDLGRLIKCCNPYPQKNGSLIPICAQNIIS